MGKFHPRSLHLLLTALCAFAASASPRPRLEKQTVDAKQGEVRQIARIKCNGSVTFFAIAPDSKHLAYCDTVYLPGNKGWSELVLLDMTAGKELQRKRGNSVGPGVFSAEGKLLALGHGLDRKPTIWDVEKWEDRLSLEVPDKCRVALPFAFSPREELIAGASGTLHGGDSVGGGPELLLWDAATGKCRTLGKLRLAEERDASLEPFRDRKPLPPNREPTWHWDRDTTWYFAEDGSPFLFVPGCGGTTIWDLERGKPLQSYVAFRDWYRGCRITARGQLLTLPKYQAMFSIPTLPLEARKDNSFMVSTRALSPDGKRLVAVGITPENQDKNSPPSTVIIWDVSALHPLPPKYPEPPTPEQRKRLWCSLFEEDDGSTINRGSREWRTHQSMFQMVSQPQEAIPFLRKKLGPPREFKRIARLIDDLDSDDFKTRDRAVKELEQFGHFAEAALKEALTKDPSADKKRLLEHLLAKLRPNPPAPIPRSDHVPSVMPSPNNIRSCAETYELRLLRIIDVLEHIATAEARELLQAIADGGYGPAFAAPAKEALERAAKKKPKD